MSRDYFNRVQLLRPRMDATASADQPHNNAAASLQHNHKIVWNAIERLMRACCSNWTFYLGHSRPAAAWQSCTASLRYCIQLAAHHLQHSCRPFNDRPHATIARYLQLHPLFSDFPYVARGGSSCKLRLMALEVCAPTAVCRMLHGFTLRRILT